MENIFDETVPQSVFNKRSFSKNWHQSDTIAENKTTDADETKCIASFVIKVIFRQNASWQGIVSRPEMGDEAKFRSELELLLLIDSAMSQCGYN